MKNKKNIGIIYGGFSSEKEISIASGKHVASLIDKNIYNVFEVFINEKNWIVNDNYLIDKSDFSFEKNGKKIKFYAVIIVIHGNPGENGILQSYFELLNIPYVGCNVLASALTFNKFYCNNFLRPFGINIAPSIIVRKNQKYDLIKQIKQIGLPVFIKPNAGGSSFGTAKVKSEEQIQNAIQDAFEESNEVIAEKFIQGRELTCAVLKFNEKIKALTPLEVISKNEFFDYEAKYNPELNFEIVPAPVEQNILEECKKISVKIYDILNCNGIVRIDYILTKDGKLYFLEVNSIPGMTAASIVPKIAKYDNINLTEVYSQMIEEAAKQKKDY